MIVTLKLPNRKLSPNVQVHYLQRADLVRSHRKRAKDKTRQAMLRQAGEGPWPWSRVKVQVVWYAKRKPFPDGDNTLAILKSTFDGIADAGIVQNDKRFLHQPPLFRCDKDKPRVEIVLTPF